MKWISKAVCCGNFPKVFESWTLLANRHWIVAEMKWPHSKIVSSHFFDWTELNWTDRIGSGFAHPIHSFKSNQINWFTCPFCPTRLAWTLANCIVESWTFFVSSLRRPSRGRRFPRTNVLVVPFHSSNKCSMTKKAMEMHGEENH